MWWRETRICTVSALLLAGVGLTALLSGCEDESSPGAAGGGDTAGSPQDTQSPGADSVDSAGEPGLPAQCEEVLAKHQSWICDIWGWTFEDWRPRLPLLEGDAAQCPEAPMQQSDVFVAYPDYRGHAGCHMLLGVACMNGWLILNDDATDPAALRPYEDRCASCTPEAPCTHLLSSTKGVMSIFPGCAFQLPCGDYPLQFGPDDPAPLTVRVGTISEDGGGARLVTNSRECACECSGLASCGGQALASPKEWAPITSFTAHIPEAEPLTVTEPTVYAVQFSDEASATSDGTQVSCRVARCEAVQATR